MMRVGVEAFAAAQKQGRGQHVAIPCYNIFTIPLAEEASLQKELL